MSLGRELKMAYAMICTKERTPHLEALRGPFLWGVILIFILCLPGPVSAKRLHLERYYQEAWCKDRGGQVEVRLPDKTRCDCLTKTHAIEFDFGNKWAESIGQSLYYSLQTGKRAGVVLILEDPKDYKFWIRLNTTIKHFDLPIDTWKICGAGWRP